MQRERKCGIKYFCLVRRRLCYFAKYVIARGGFVSNFEALIFNVGRACMLFLRLNELFVDYLVG